MKTLRPSINLGRVVESRLFVPVLALSVILLFDLVFVRGFFNLEMKDGHLYGSLIDILRNSAPTVVLAIGMTLVIATGGVDLSVGAIMAIAASVACILIDQDRRAQSPGEHHRGRRRPHLQLRADPGRDPAVAARSRGVWPVERTPGVLWTDPAHGGHACLLYTSPSPRDRQKSRMPSSA